MGFRHGISPCWEDPQNADGGKWSVSFVGRSPTAALESLRTVIDAVLCGSFPNHQLVNGVVLSIKEWGYRMSIWTSRIPSTSECGRALKWLRARVRPKYSSFYTHQ